MGFHRSIVARKEGQIEIRIASMENIGRVERRGGEVDIILASSFRFSRIDTNTKDKTIEKRIQTIIRFHCVDESSSLYGFLIDKLRIFTLCQPSIIIIIRSGNNII